MKAWDAVHQAYLVEDRRCRREAGRDIIVQDFPMGNHAHVLSGSSGAAVPSALRWSNVADDHSHGFVATELLITAETMHEPCAGTSILLQRIPASQAIGIP